jgi:hypothetical protein
VIEFKAKKVIVDGKETLTIEPVCEEIVFSDGSQSVIIHAPSLALIGQFKEANGIE